VESQERRFLRVRDDVYRWIVNDARLDASDIEVEVDNGAAILRGTVPTRQAKRLAEGIAAAIPGVRSVHSHLRVDQLAA
jgi:osmotically-inducible protein OsmY